MASQSKRPLEDFFKPYSESLPTVPRKRPSPSSADADARNVTRKFVPKTPGKTVTFRDVTPKSVKSLFFSPKSQNSLPIRSPNPHLSPSPSRYRQTTVFQAGEKSPTRGGNVSFTFSDISDRSQKVIQDGKVVAVRDSDEDTESLESLDDIFGRKRDAAATSDSSPYEDIEIERSKTLAMFTAGRSVPIVGKDKLRALYAKEKTFRFDLSTVLDDHFGDEEAERNITQLRAGFDGARDSKEEDHLDKQLLASVVRTGEADEEDVARLLNAVERTEALSTEKTFRFFDTKKPTKPKSQRKDAFPKAAMQDQLWVSTDDGSYERAFLSGYFSELAASDDLPDEVLRWTFDQMLTEPRPKLRQAYIDCLEAGSKTWTRLNITAADVQSVFQILGASGQCLRDANPIEATYHPIEEQTEQDHKYLLSILQMFHVICPDMDFLALSKLVSVVLRICLDTAVMSNNLVCTSVEDLLSTLLSIPDNEARNHVHERFLSDATNHLKDPRLQVQLLNHILPTTTASADLRKDLADIFLLGKSLPDHTTKHPSTTLEDLSVYISTSPSFSLTRHSNSEPTDYGALTALTQILNTAVLSSTPTPHRHTSTASTPSSSPRKPHPDEVRFNNTVDTLADQLHTLFVSIKDTGASHMRRTEAKDALQALYFRLLYSVRTQVRRKKHVFDSTGAVKGRWVSAEDYREKERGGEFMQRFLGKKTGKIAG